MLGKKRLGNNVWIIEDVLALCDERRTLKPYTGNGIQQKSQKVEHNRDIHNAIEEYNIVKCLTKPNTASHISSQRRGPETGNRQSKESESSMQ